MPESESNLDREGPVAETPAADGPDHAVASGAGGPVLPVGSLKQRTILGFIWQSAGYGATNVLRLAALLVVSRWLFPEAYGVMAAVNAYVAGLIMLSDLGVVQAVVRSERGDEPGFLNTAWTISVVRGFLLYLFALLLTWPMAAFYHEPQLLSILPVASLVVILHGFRSTAFMSAKRHLTISRVTMMEFLSHLASILAMITLAWIYRSVWALVAGSIVSGLVGLLLSFLLFPGPRPRFRWDPSAWREIYAFGKWIFLSTALTFIAAHGDRMLLGHLMGMLVLGLYGIARNFSMLFEDFVQKLGSGILYPAFSEIVRNSPERLRSVYYRTRLRLDALFLPAIGILIVVGGRVIRFMLDDRYREAGWMIQYLMLRGAIVAVVAACQAGLVALGDSRVIFFRSLGRALWIVVGLPLGWQLAGVQGLCLAAATAELPGLVVMWVAFRRRGLLDLRREALAGGLLGAGLGVGLLIESLLTWSGLVEG